MATLDLGLVGNSRIAALIDREASIVWWCYPYLDSDPICCALLQPDTPEDCAIGVIGVRVEKGAALEQHYVVNTAVLRTLLGDAEGNRVEVLDFAPRFAQYGRVHAPSMLVRIVRRLSGRPRISLCVRPAADYGSHPATMRLGAHHISFQGVQQGMRVTTDSSIVAITEQKPFFLEDSVTLLMGPDETVDGSPKELGRTFYEKTVDHWQRWVRNLAVPFEWQDVVIRAAITLKLNAFDDTGAIVAAVTTSIPEAPHSGRNWDYRYCWLRDSYFVVNALNRLGATGTMERYLEFILNIIADARDQPLQPLYGIRREALLEERIAPHLAGYRGMGPVRFGNLAYLQVQNDVWGAGILASAHAFFDQRLGRPGGEFLFRELERLGELAVQHHDRPDAGIWELRGSKRVHTFSTLMCWAGCHRLASIARQLGLQDRHQAWAGHAQLIHRKICGSAWNAGMNSFVSTFGGDRLDASLLLMAELQFLPPDDPRLVGTVEAIERHLRMGDFLLRYDEEDDFGRPETAFLVCTLWWILALAYIGRKEQARALFANVLARRNHLGLLAEDVDTGSGELWGNFPQTYSMVGLIQCAMRLSISWDDAY